VRTRFGSTALRFWEKMHSHPIGNRLKTIDFIGGFELHGSKKRLIPSHSTKKRQKRPILEGFCGVPVWSSCGMAVKKNENIRLTSFRAPAIH
jgi:hypothetical protein